MNSLVQDHEDDHDSGTMVKRGNSSSSKKLSQEEVDSGTLVLSGRGGSGGGTTDTFITHDEGTMISHDSGTMIDHSDSGTMIEHGNSGTMVDNMESDMGTMVINSDEDLGDDDTMKRKKYFVAGWEKPRVHLALEHVFTIKHLIRTE